MSFFFPTAALSSSRKETGKVKIMNGRQITGTALDLPVAQPTASGIARDRAFTNLRRPIILSIFITPAAQQDGGAPISESIKRYSFDGSKLTFKKEGDRSACNSGPNHNGGRSRSGTDNKLYIVAGELNRNELTSNHNNGTINRIGSIWRVNSSGSASPQTRFMTLSQHRDPIRLIVPLL